MSWGPNRRLLRRALIAAASRSRPPRRPPPMSSSSARAGPPPAQLSGRPVAARQCADHLARRRHGRDPGQWRHAHLPRARHLLAEHAGRGGSRDANSNGRIARIGAVRNAGIDPATARPSGMSTSRQSGTFCLTSAANVMLWRPDATAPVRFTISGPGGTRTLDWAANAPTAAWPGGASVAEWRHLYVHPAGRRGARHHHLQGADQRAAQMWKAWPRR